MNTLERSIGLPFVLLAGLSVNHFSVAQEGNWTLSTGVDASAGEYDGDSVDTEIYYVPLTTSYQTESWRFQATVPWIRIEGPGTVVGVGDGGIVIPQPPDTNQTVRSESGLGDIWLGASYLLEPTPLRNVYLDLGARVKLPTASEDRLLGTGEIDYVLQVDMYKPLGRFTPFLAMAYRFRGQSSQFDLRDTWYASAGSDLSVSSGLHIGMSLDYQEATHAAVDDALEIVGYANQALGSRFDLMIYGYAGLSASVPDQGIGLQLTYGF